jgi:hypothetical protein
MMMMMNKSNNETNSSLPWQLIDGECLSDPTVGNLKNFQILVLKFFNLFLYKIKQVYSTVKFIRGSERIQGNIYVTNFRFYFKSGVSFI